MGDEEQGTAAQPAPSEEARLADELTRATETYAQARERLISRRGTATREEYLELLAEFELARDQRAAVERALQSDA